MNDYKGYPNNWLKSAEQKEVLPGRDVPAPDKPDDLLVKILSTKRCHGTLGDINFRQWLVKEINTLGQKVEFLAEGVMYLHIGESKALFSCHVDTCHSTAESDGSAQELVYDTVFGDILLSKDSKSACLGADDGNGIYILLKMIAAKKPGGYIFNTCEERGGIGSRAVLAKHSDILKRYDRTVAFDRAVQRNGSPEVIITQGGQACASTTAGTELALKLTNSALFEHDWVVSHGGTFTDTKVFSAVIREAFNIGCFYAQQHTPYEWCNVAQLEQLVIAVLKIDWEKLTVARVIPPPAPVIPYKAPTNFKKPSKKKPTIVEYTNDVDFESMAFDEIQDLVGDDDITNAIIGLLTALDAERGRVKRLQKLLGLT